MTYTTGQKLDCQLSTMVTPQMFTIVGEMAKESMLNRSDIVRLALIQYINEKTMVSNEPVRILKEKKAKGNQ